MFGSKFKKGLMATAAAGALAISVSATAQAGSVGSFINGGNNTASDDNREYLIDRNLGASGDWDSNPITPDTIAVAGQLDVGDSLRGAFSINALNSVGANLGGTTGNNEWSGVFQAIVSAKTVFGPIVLYTFAPDPAFAGSTCGGVPNCVSVGAPGAGAMIVMFEDSSVDLALDFDDPLAGAIPGMPALADDGTPHVGPHPGSGAGHTPPSSADVSVGGANATEEAFIATATDGAHYWTLGFAGNPGEGWSATSTALGDNVIAAFGFASGVSGGTFNAGLSCLASSAKPCIDILPLTAGAFGPTQFAVTGSLRGVADLDTSFEVSSDVTFSFFAIPEPGTISLLGLGLLATGFAARRKKAKKVA